MESETVAKNRIEFQWGSKLQGTSSEALYNAYTDSTEKTLSQKDCFSLSALKPEAEMISKAFRGRYDFDKPENITDLYRQSNRKN